jgi:hypothetical protein
MGSGGGSLFYILQGYRERVLDGQTIAQGLISLRGGRCLAGSTTKEREREYGHNDKREHAADRYR